MGYAFVSILMVSVDGLGFLVVTRWFQVDGLGLGVAMRRDNSRATRDRLGQNSVKARLE